LAASAQAQDSPAERLKALADPKQAMEAKLEREKLRPPFEFFRHQIAPFEVLPYAKPNHWSWMMLEARANQADYTGLVRTAVDVAGKPQVQLRDMPHQMVFRREARLTKGQSTRLGLPIMLPRVPKSFIVELARPDALRPDGYWDSSMLMLEPHQMLVPILAADSNQYSNWSRSHGAVPGAVTKDTGQMEMERMRYYRMVLPQTPQKPPPLAGHPLVWSTTSHVLWDGLASNALDLGQQQAMVDWLFWGGQLTVIASGPGLASVQDSFLGPFLPATASGENPTLNPAELESLSLSYRPPLWLEDFDDVPDFQAQLQAPQNPPSRYRAPEPIHPTREQPPVLTGLDPKPGATVIPWPGGDDARRLGVEWRVGRGRVLMLAIRPTDPTLRAWPGIDTLIRRLILRRPEERKDYAGNRWTYSMLNGPQLSWLRYLARDLNARPLDDNSEPASTGVRVEVPLPSDQVAAWTDTAALPDAARRTLEKASGITIPGSGFVLKVVLAYVIALVPLNWLICRYLLRRSELAWVVAPLLSLGFAVVVERAAAYDMGFDRACDEIDVLEIQGGYDRAHLSRFAAIYSTGRDRYRITYPNHPTALVLPLSQLNELRGEELATSVSQSQPEPGLVDFLVQPRSLALFRSEAMVGLGGTLKLEGDDPAAGTLSNGSNLELRGAMLIQVDTGARYELGTIAPNSSIQIASPPQAAGQSSGSKLDWADLEGLLEPLRDYSWGQPEDAGEWRLVAYCESPHPGQSIEPAVDRHRGFQLVVAHLRFGPPPDPAGPTYYTSNEPIPLAPPPINADLADPPVEPGAELPPDPPSPE
jgi:hypothetical protein